MRHLKNILKIRTHSKVKSEVELIVNELNNTMNTSFA